MTKYLACIVLSLLAHGALAQQPSAAPAPKNDDLDVTMQIIVDPDARLPDEVVRRIPLPERKPAAPASSNAESKSQGKGNDKQDKSAAREAKELGREADQTAKDRAKEQREQARRAAAEERRRRNNDNHGPPNNPPGHQPH
jgi:hypothetical protein